MISLRLSQESVEKVVNPPQNPDIKSKLQFDEMLFLSCIPTKKPRIKQAKKFETKVPMGKFDVDVLK